MDTYAIKYAISEVKKELKNAEIDHIKFTDSTLIDFAFKALMLDEIRQLNKNFERLNEFNLNYRR